MSYSVAIDGPAGAGKSTIAKQIAKKMSYIYVDTGAMYRAMALFLLRSGVDANDSNEISEKCKQADITIAYKNSEQIVLLNGEDVNNFIRTEEVGNMASISSSNIDVRLKLVELQRKLAKTDHVIMDGRDIGTYVLPDANVKVFLTASSIVRAKRRFDELKEKGVPCDLETIENDIIERDERDMNRKMAPLKQADDAILIDSSAMTIEEVIDTIIKLCK